MGAIVSIEVEVQGSSIVRVLWFYPLSICFREKIESSCAFLNNRGTIA